MKTASRTLSAGIQNLRRAVTGEDSDIRDDDGNKDRPISLTVGGVKLVYSASEKRWRSDELQMFKAADTINLLLDDNDKLHAKIEELEAERLEEKKVADELIIERRKNAALKQELSEAKQDLLASFDTIKALKQRILDPSCI